MKNEFTLTIYSEDQLRLINRLSSMFLRKQVEVLSFNMSVCEIDKMYRYTIVIKETLDQARNLAAQIEKIIEVFKCYFNLNEETIFRQTALFKIPTEFFLTEAKMELLFKENNLKISEIYNDYTIMEATGTEDEISFLTEKLISLGLIEFVKSSRIALLKSNEGFSIL